MTLTEAFKFSRTDPGNPVSNQWIRDWNHAQAVIVAAGYCPDCAAGSHQKQKLGKWQPGNIAEYAGRRCPVCEQFWK